MCSPPTSITSSGRRVRRRADRACSRSRAALRPATVALVTPAPELDVGAAAGHVRGDRHRARLPGARDDLRLLLVVLGVQHVVRDAARA